MNKDICNGSLSKKGRSAKIRELVVKILRLPEELREKLKIPLGLLIRGEVGETMLRLKKLLDKEKPVKIISVGDFITECMEKNRIFPDVSIMDNRVMRQPIEPISFEADETFHARNPPGTISDEAWNTVKKVMNSDKRTKIIVEGEEDLLALPAVLFAPEGSAVVYGQPREGVVLIRVTEEKRREIKSIIDAMEHVHSKS